MKPFCTGFYYLGDKVLNAAPLLQNRLELLAFRLHSLVTREFPISCILCIKITRPYLRMNFFKVSIYFFAFNGDARVYSRLLKMIFSQVIVKTLSIISRNTNSHCQLWKRNAWKVCPEVIFHVHCINESLVAYIHFKYVYIYMYLKASHGPW